MSDERHVLGVWKWVQVRLAQPFEGIPKGKWTARIPLHPFSQVAFDTKAEAYAALRKFTEARLEEIRLKKEEISHIREDIDVYRMVEDADGEVYLRILASLESQLAALSEGMKPEMK